MPIQAKPLFRADVLEPKLDLFKLPAAFDAKRATLRKWRHLIASKKIDGHKETGTLSSFLEAYFYGLLGYSSPADSPERYTFSPEPHVEVDGKFADGAIGVFNGSPKFLAVLEGKGPLDPFDRPFAGRKMSAVDQVFRYAINLKCDWVLVTNLKEIRLYHKGNDFAHFERSDPYNPRPIWDNFRGPFRSIDKGNAKLDIDEFNGGGKQRFQEPFQLWETVPETFVCLFMSHALRILVVVLTWLYWNEASNANVRPNSLISEGMVLQQGMETRLWGTADVGEKVTVRFRGQEVITTALDGYWSVRIDCGLAGGPFPMTIGGKNLLSFKSVMVGEVWVCSGQSNMGWPLATRPNSKELQGTEDAEIRLFKVNDTLSDIPQIDVQGSQWQECNSKSLLNFSAVAYYFGRDLRKALKTPIGLIVATYGGSPVQNWLTPESQAKLPDDTPELKALRNQKLKTVHFNGMIAPLTPFAIRGVIWFQGEANTESPLPYRTLFPALIDGWRKQWGQGDFPFLFVQLAPYGKIVSEPRESKWAILRETQRLTNLTVPKTGMVVITDYGHETDIHTKPKQPVGERLALTARALVYGHQIVYSGPTYSSMQVDDGKIVLRFKHIGGGLETKALVLEDIVKDPKTGKSGGALHVRQGSGDIEPLNGFTIAGQDRKYVNAQAEIRGDKVVIWNPATPKPVAIRYGWADYPTGNLFNKEGLPASPFQTDDLPKR